MFSSMMDHKNSIVNKLLKDNKIDPGTFSFMESGWWALHAAAITGILLLGSRMNKRY